MVSLDKFASDPETKDWINFFFFLEEFVGILTLSDEK